jgi:DNA polymerase-3 subunit chi
MPEVSFYHLSTSTLEKALPRLLDKIYSSGHRVLLMAPSEEKVEELNGLLWSFSTRIFLPHGSIKDPLPEEQPIFLTASNDNPNNSDILFMINGVTPSNIDNFNRVVYMFDGADDNELQEARKRWASYKKNNYQLTYFQQTESGGWEKKDF